MIVAGNLEHAIKISTAAGATFNPAIDHVVSRSRDGKLLGGVIFTQFTGASIAIHVAGFAPRWINSNMLWISFNYPFEQLRISKLIAPVPSCNHRALEFDLKLGFKQEARIADIFPDGDLLVLSMRREDCRWLGLKPRGA